MYVVINNEAVWGMGETEEVALERAREWVCSVDEDGHRVHDVPVVSYHEMRNGAAGFAVLPCSPALAARVEAEGGAIAYEVVDGVVVTEDEVAAAEAE